MVRHVVMSKCKEQELALIIEYRMPEIGEKNSCY
ncbi:hypothetical protein SH1V18_08370 [Vallitalea longa]|uniref:Uncharacterized protein n=1 Tax=Vallitalea longa TaxID=2936439 RepID=A0A9W5Y7L2_9FIRM|nr:hypothetical protein SH1V18_08370 [Vallitalea longa]